MLKTRSYTPTLTGKDMRIHDKKTMHHYTHYCRTCSHWCSNQIYISTGFYPLFIPSHTNSCNLNIPEDDSHLIDL